MSEIAAAEQKSYKPGERSIADIIKDLSKRVADRHLRHKKQGGANIAYVSWFDRVKYLDLYAPGWSNEITRIDNIGGKLIITVRLTIPAAEGLFSREATGQESEEKDTFGDSSSNAEAMALSRASAKFGLGLYLYDSSGSQNDVEYHGKSTAPSEVQNPVAKTLSDVVTVKQLGMARALAREIGLDLEEECRELFQCATDELSKRAASALIEHLQKLQAQM